MRVLVACEFSGIVRSAFLAMGHDAWSCDLNPSWAGGPHLIGDVRDALNGGWDMMIAFPPCTYLATSGNRAMTEQPWRRLFQLEALEFVRTLLNAPIPKIALENPVGVISTQVRPPDQIIQPWWYGDPYVKQTCLWLKNLPPLKSTGLASHPYINHARIRDPVIRSVTFPGIAQAMADQWGVDPS